MMEQKNNTPENPSQNLLNATPTAADMEEAVKLRKTILIETAEEQKRNPVLAFLKGEK